ncbi:MAG TPA: aminotransferase class V-fold PLP-dependent enzyme [Polyangiaceae bacterium]|nr:aminotransferase class V-fold PLP-dependent enzyme [Polyangiaceae bacterium]
MAPLPLDFVRGHFPGLDQEGWALFDNAGGSLALEGVAAAAAEHLRHAAVQLGASYALSRRASERVAAGVAAVARLAGARPREVVVGPSTTQLLQNLARALGPRLAPGDEVVVTDCDHEANRSPWARLAERGVVVREWRLDRASLALRLDDLEPLMSPRTRLVCFPHVSNLLGTLHPAADFARFVRERGALSCVDGVAYAPHRRLDVGALGVDFYAFSLYKVYGPHLGALYVRDGLWAGLDNVNHDFFGPDAVPYKLQPGGPNHELTSSLVAIEAYLLGLAAAVGAPPEAPAGERLALAFDAIAGHEEALSARFLAGLARLPGARVWGEPGPARARRVPTFSLTFEGRRSPDVVARVDEARVAVRHGDFYAPRLVERLGLGPQGGVVRASMVHYNTEAEVDRLLEALEAATR